MALGRLERRPGAKPMSDINMTPLIDVMLVLLIIFMLTAPLMTSGLKLNLPKSEAAPTEAPPESLTIGISADGSLYLNDKNLTNGELSAQVMVIAKQRPDSEVQLQADQAVPYGRVAELIGVLQKAGLHRIAFVTAPAPGTQ